MTNRFLVAVQFLISTLVGISSIHAQPRAIERSLHYGHPEVTLYAVASDVNETIFLATTQGFFQYNGKDLKQMNWISTAHIPGKMIIAGDSLIIGHTNGVLTIASLSKQKIVSQDTLTHSSITEILAHPDGALLVGSAGNGLYLIDKTGNIANADSSLSDPFINDIHFNSATGLATVATDRGLDQIEIDQSESSLHVRQQVLQQNDLYTSLLGADTSEIPLLVAGHSTGIGQIINQSWQQLSSLSESLPFGKLYYALNQVWILADQNKLYRLSGAESESPTIQLIQRFDDVPVVDIIGVKEGYLLVWLQNGQLIMIPAQYAIYNEINNIHLSGVTAVCRGKEGIWVARNDSIISLSESAGTIHIERVIPLPEKSEFPIVSLAEHKNYLLGGSFGDGLYVYDLDLNDWISHLRETDGLENNSILDIASGQDNIWISTMSGVQYISGNPLELTSLTGTPGYVYCLRTGPDNRLYVGSQGESMFVNDGLKLKPAAPNDTSSNSFISIIFDAENRGWGLTTDARIFLLENQSLVAHPMNDQLEQLGAYRLFTTHSGNAGLITENALYHISANSMAHEIMGAPELFKSNYQNISATDAVGNLWIARPDGLVKIKKNELNSKHVPQIQIAEMLVNDKKTDITHSRFGYRENDIGFEFLSVWHDPFRPVVNQYRMNGLDTTWRTIVDNELHFAQLSPGKYELELRTLFGPTLHPVSHHQYAFSVAQPFYFQWWFLLSAASAFVVGLYIAIRWRDRRIALAMAVRSERIQTQFEVLKNQINPHFLFNSFNTLAALIPDDPKKAEIFTEKLSAFFREMLTSKDNDTNTLERELKLASDFIFLQQSRYGQNLIYEVKVPDEKLPCEVPALALQILIENAVKHNQISTSSPLHISIYTSENSLIVENNLQLRSSPIESTGLGLKNLSNRMQILTGKNIDIDTSFGNFKVTIPLISCD